MDRTNELIRAAQVYGKFDEATAQTQRERSPYINIALRVAQFLNNNELLVSKMESL
jgi:hypothetical protein